MEQDSDKDQTEQKKDAGNVVDNLSDNLRKAENLNYSVQSLWWRIKSFLRI